MPEGLLLGEGFTLRVAMPCAAKRVGSRANGMPPANRRSLRRDSLGIAATQLNYRSKPL
jgi:hypothetical protein